MTPSSVVVSVILTVLAATPGSNANFTRHTLPSSAFSMRDARADLVSFKTFGKSVNVGLDFIFPFLRVPIKRTLDQYGNEPALININTASVILTGLLTTGGIIVGHLMRNFGLEGRADDTEHDEKESAESDDDEESKAGRSNTYDERRLLDLLAPFKLIYKNETGDRVETTLPHLLITIEETFLENDISLPACMQKSICSIVRRAGDDVRGGRASSFQKIVDGMSHVSWLVQSIRSLSPLHEAIDAGKNASVAYCDVKYPKCKWAAPEEKLVELIDASVNFV